MPTVIALPPRPRHARRVRPRRHRVGSRIGTALAAAALALGVGLVTAPAAHAADITMPDANLKAAVNQALNDDDGGTRADTDPIDETDALSLTSLNVSNKGITNLTGLEEFTNLTTLNLSLNPLASSARLAPIANLTSLQTLHMSSAEISQTDLSGLSALTGLTTLYIGGATNTIYDLTPITAFTGLQTLSISNLGVWDLTPLAELTDLSRLYAIGTQVTDLTPLVDLAPFAAINLIHQFDWLPTAAAGAPTPNPLIDLDGNPVVPTSTDPGFSYDAASNSWTFASPGAKNITWNVVIGSSDVQRFSGTMAQDIGIALDPPAVDQPQCTDDGTVTDPAFAVPDVDDVSYYQFARNGGEFTDDAPEVQPGDEVTILAWPAEGSVIGPENGWERGSDGELIYTVTIDEAPDCATPETESTELQPTETTTTPADPSSPTETTTTPTDTSTPQQTPDPTTTSSTETAVILAETGTNVIAPAAAGFGLLILGGALMLVRRRTGQRLH